MVEKKTVNLLSPFPKKLVRKAPAGKFGDYVPHAHYVERLRDSGVKYSWSVEAVYGDNGNNEKRIVGAIGTITIEGMGSFMGVGDVDTFKAQNSKFNDGTNFKDAESDAFKRACMRFGLGVELWSGSTQSEEEATAVAPDGYTQEMAEADAKVEVTKVDMRRKENKLSAEELEKMQKVADEMVSDDVQEEDDSPKVEAPPSNSQAEFIDKTVSDMLAKLTNEHKAYVMESGASYIKARNFPNDKAIWSHKQMDSYLNHIEKMMKGDFVPDGSMIDNVSNILGEVVDKTEQLNSFRDDLLCPFCDKKVFDNRNSKKTEKSPDFVCSTNEPSDCGGHTGKWRKSWWLNSSDLPKEWGF